MSDLENRLRRMGTAITPTADDGARPSARTMAGRAEARRDRTIRSLALGATCVIAAVTAAVTLVRVDGGPRQHTGLLTGSSEATTSTSPPRPKAKPSATTAPRTPTAGTRIATTPVAPSTTSATPPRPIIPTVVTSTTTRPAECDPATFGNRPPLHIAGAGGRVWAAFGNEILASSADGGRTWSQECFDDERLQFTRLVALSATRVIAIAGSERPGIVAPDVVVQSDDGGRTWSTVQGLSLESRHQLSGITFSGGSGWLYGGILNETRDRFEARLWRSSDAGRRWQPVPFPSTAGLITSVSFVDDSTGWLVTNDDKVFRTSDSGETWTKVEVPPNTGWIRAVAATEHYVYVTATSRTSPALDGTQKLLASGDGGATWTEKPASTWQVVAVDDEVAVAIGDEVLRTTDGGVTWSSPPRPPPGHPAWFETVTRDGLVLWATSPGGALTSLDGGESWVSFEVPLR